MTNKEVKIRANGPHYRYANVVPFKCESVREIVLKLIDGDFEKAYNTSNAIFIDIMANCSQNDLQWNVICDAADVSLAFDFAYEFVIEAIDKKILTGEHSDVLCKHFNKFKNLEYKTRKILCFDEIDDFLINNIVPNDTKLIKTFNFALIEDTDIREAFREAIKQRATKWGVKPFYDYLCNTKCDELDWFKICDITNLYRCYNFAFCVIWNLLNNNKYKGTYSDDLYAVFPQLTILYNEHSSQKDPVFCKEKIRHLNLVYPENNKKCLPLFVEFQNPFLKDFLLNFFISKSESKSKWRKFPNVVYNIENCLGRFRNEIHKPEDYNMKMFWEQINWFKRNCTDPEDRGHGISYVLMLYRMLITNYPEHDFLKDCTTMNKSLLFSYTGKIHIDNDYWIGTFDPANNPGGVEKICLLLNGMDKYSTKLKSEDFCSYDLSSVKNEKYRALLVEYLLSIPNISYLTKSSTMLGEIEGMAFLNTLKSQDNYPNKNLIYITNQEAVLIRQNYAIKYADSLNNRNRHIGCMRRFFNWCKLNKKMEFDDLVFDYLKDYERINKSNAVAIPENHLAQISTALINKMSSDHMARCCYVVMNILITTQFRIGHVLSLTTDCIRPTAKPNQFRLYAYHKTGHGSYESFIITERIYKLLVDLIEDTESYRERSPIDADKKYIFLIDGDFGVRKLLPRNFTDYIEKLCTELGLPRYNASNFRDTHMTMALEHALKTGKSDAEFSTLTGHRRIDTTKSHYIDWNMEAMLEATYGLNLDLNEYIPKKFEVTSKLPEGLDNKNSVVQNGCGNCKSDKCVMKTTLPCLICEHFITTPAHEPYFVKAIEELDKLIEAGKLQHDVEDLITTKKLHVMYLNAIYKHLKEAEDGNNS